MLMLCIVFLLSGNPHAVVRNQADAYDDGDDADDDADDYANNDDDDDADDDDD